MIVVSYFTDEKYEKYATDLVASLKRVGLKHDVCRVPDLGSWKKNTHHKAVFIREKMREHPGEDSVVWIDADAMVFDDPWLFRNPSFDVAAYRWREGALYHYGAWHNWGRLMSGTVYFKKSPFSEMVLDAWIRENEKHPERMDQKNLATVLSKVDPKKLSCLPPEYCWIDRYMRAFAPTASPVIVHAASFLKNAPDRIVSDGSPPILLESYHGLGDAFYMRPAVRRFSERHPDTYLSNPWPTLFSDLPVKLVKPKDVTLRVQRDNAERPFNWNDRPVGAVTKFLEYGEKDFEAALTPIGAFLKRAGISDKPDLEDFRFPVPTAWTEKWRGKLPKSFGIVHRPTLRREWKNPARLPREDYIPHLSNLDPDRTWVSLEPAPGKEEWVVGPPAGNVRMRITDDTISVEDLVAIVSLADVVLTNVCFLLPLAPAVGTPVFVVFGGSVGPELLFDPCMGSRVGWAAPEPFCNCFRLEHDCNKDIPISKLEESWREFLARSR